MTPEDGLAAGRRADRTAAEAAAPRETEIMAPAQSPPSETQAPETQQEETENAELEDSRDESSPPESDEETASPYEIGKLSPISDETVLLAALL